MTPLYHTRLERWPQFTLRGLFVLGAVVGVILWLGIQLKWIRDRHEAKHLLDESGVLRVMAVDTGPVAPLSIRIFGEPGYGRVAVLVRNATLTPEDQIVIDRVKALFPEAKVIHGVPQGG